MTASTRRAPGLPLRDIHIAATAGGGLARTVVRQRYENTADEAIEVVYKTPLPSDGAVAGYAFDIGGRRIEGVVKRRDDARKAYDEALYDGRTASLLDEERDGLFTLQLGAVPPGAEVTAELTVDHPLSWRPGEGWQWRFPTTLVPRYLGAPGRIDDADRLRFPVSEDGTGVTVSGYVQIEDAADGPRRVELPEAAPDRDLLVGWTPEAAGDEAAAGHRIESVRREGDEVAHALLTLTPPAPERAEAAAMPRDLIVLLDTSGSMMGEPLAQAKGVVGALIDGLGEGDRLEMLAFAMDVERWDPEGRQDARAWLRTRQAGGGTEMASAVVEALAPLRAGAQRQVVLVTDGHVGFEEEVVTQVHEGLPDGSRLHCVGVGSGINRTLTRHASRAGRGREVLVAIGEDSERAAKLLDAVTRAPVLTELEITGDGVQQVAPERPADVLLGEPARVYLRLSPEGGQVRVTGMTAAGPWEAIIEAPPASSVAKADPRAAVAGAYGRERIADLELSRVAGASATSVDARVEQLGLELGLSTRLTSWVAVDDQVSLKPGEELLVRQMPHDLAYGVSFEGVSAGAMYPAAPRASFTGRRLRKKGAQMFAPMAAAPPSPFFDKLEGAPAPPEADLLMSDEDAEYGDMSIDADGPPPPDVELVVRDGELVIVFNCEFELSVGEIVVLDLGLLRTRRVRVVKDLGGAYVIDGPVRLAGRVKAVRARNITLSTAAWG